MDVSIKDEAALKQIVRELRQRSDLSQGELAQRVGLLRKTVSEFENSTSSRIDTVLRLLEGLGCEIVIRMPEPVASHDLPEETHPEDDEISFDRLSP